MILPPRWLGEVASIDEIDQLALHPERLVNHLLLFDKVLIHSARLREFRPLLATFGFDGTIALLRSGAIGVVCQRFTTGSTGQLAVLQKRATKGLLPLHSYSFSSVAAGRTGKEYMSQCFADCVRSIEDLSMRQERILVREIAARLVDPVEAVTTMTGSQLKSDLVANASHIGAALAVELKRRYGADAAQRASIRVIPIDSEDYRVEANLVSVLNLSETESHQIVEKSLLAVAGVNQRLAEMKGYDALMNFWYRDIPVLESKLSYVQSIAAPELAEARVMAVLNWPLLPDLTEGLRSGAFDLQKFLELRETDEARAFRAWLHTASDVEIEHVRELSGSLRARLGALVSSGVARGIRVVTSTSMGLFPGMGTASAALGLLDAFVVERLFGKHSPVLAFLLGQYSSLFKEPPRPTK